MVSRDTNDSDNHRKELGVIKVKSRAVKLKAFIFIEFRKQINRTLIFNLKKLGKLDTKATQNDAFKTKSIEIALSGQSRVTGKRGTK